MHLGIHLSEWLDWFSALDWSHLDNVLSSIVGVTVLTGMRGEALSSGWIPLFTVWAAVNLREGVGLIGMGEVGFLR